MIRINSKCIGHDLSVEEIKNAVNSRKNKFYCVCCLSENLKPEEVSFIGIYKRNTYCNECLETIRKAISN